MHDAALGVCVGSGAARGSRLLAHGTVHPSAAGSSEPAWGSEGASLFLSHLSALFPCFLSCFLCCHLEYVFCSSCMGMLTLTMHSCLKQTKPEQDVILSLSECLPRLQFTQSLCLSKSQWFGTWAHPVDWQLWFLRALLNSETAFSYCVPTQVMLWCAGFLAIPNSAWGQGAVSAGPWPKHCRQTAAAAPPGVREMGFGWASGRLCLHRFNLGQSELKRWW